MTTAKRILTGLLVLLLLMGIARSADTAKKTQNKPASIASRLAVVHVRSCINHLQQLENATQQWALEYKKSSTDTVQFSDLLPYLRDTVNTFRCPVNNKKYNEGKTITEPWTCPNYKPNNRVLSQHKYSPGEKNPVTKPLTTNLKKQKQISHKKNLSVKCISNMKQLEAATEQWALDNRKSANDVVQFSDLLPYLKDTVNTFRCPVNSKKYNEGKKITKPWICPNYNAQSPEFSSHKIQ